MPNGYVFVSYAADDDGWVNKTLVPALSEAGLRACLDNDDFIIGWDRIQSTKRAIEGSRHTTIVMTPEWVASKRAGFEALLAPTTDPAGHDPRLIPIMLKHCTIPDHTPMLAVKDFTDPSKRHTQLTLLIEQLKGSTIPDGTCTLDDTPPAPLPPYRCRRLRGDLKLLTDVYDALAEQQRLTGAADQKVLQLAQLTILEQQIAAIEDQLRGCPPST